MNAAIGALMDRVRALAADRSTLSTLQAEMKAKQEAFENETRELRTKINQVKDDVAAGEMIVRTRGIEVYAATQDKKPVPGIEIKLKKAYAVDQAAGLAWAIEKDMCLTPATLNVEAVKKLATVQPLPFVTVTEEPSVQISTDLAKVIATAEAIGALPTAEVEAL
jgi:hypothetical protein